jgi:membrane protein DedA with SNARE-associated domain
VAAAFSLGSIATPAIVVIAMAGLGAVLGTWSSSMIGSSTPSRRLSRFDDALASGQYLLMVDVPRSRVTEIEQLLERTHPEAHFEGLEPNVPAFP